MSYFNYIACSRRLELDHCSKCFLTVYSSYAEYMRSENYCRCKYRAFDSPTKARGSIHFYSQMCEAESFPLYPYTPSMLGPEENDFITHHLTQPYIYHFWHGSPDYLLKHLHSEDHLEFLSVFIGHGEALRIPVENTIDLQDYLAHRDTIWDIDFFRMVRTPPENNLTHIIPVRNPQNCSYPCAADNTDCICTIFKDSPSEWWDMKKLQDQRLL